MGKSKSTIDLTNDASGIYIVIIKNEEGISKRLRVQKINF